METLKTQINTLKKEKNAVVLAHYYVDGNVQAVADYVGDSYYLAKIAADCDAEILVFCGVEFMGESAKLLSPNKTVLMPSPDADCPMAHMATVESVNEMKKQYDDLAVVCYINSSAQLKSVSDVCVTSSNAEKIVKKLPNKNIFFIPDKNLGAYIARNSDKNILFNDGCCPIHDEISKDDIISIKKKNPNIKVLMHPECSKEVLDEADYIGSTSGIIEYAEKCDDSSLIIVTETGILWELKQKCPDKTFIFPEPLPVCADMKKITLENLYTCLKNNENEIVIDSSIKEKALIPLKRMLELAE